MTDLVLRRLPRLCWYKRHGCRFPLVYRATEGGLWIGRLYIYWPRLLSRNLTHCVGCDIPFDAPCCLPAGHPGFHKTRATMAIEALMDPDELAEQEAERWRQRGR